MQRVTSLEIMDVRTTEPHYPCKNKSGMVIGIIKGKEKRRRVKIMYPRGSGTLEWYGNMISIPALRTRMYTHTWNA